MAIKQLSFARITCGNKTNRGMSCKRWLGDIETTKEGAIARYFCRDCKVLHIITVVAKGVIKRAKASNHAAIEYDPSMTEVRDDC